MTAFFNGLQDAHLRLKTYAPVFIHAFRMFQHFIGSISRRSNICSYCRMLLPAPDHVVAGCSSAPQGGLQDAHQLLKSACGHE